MKIYYQIMGLLPAPWEDFFYRGDENKTSTNRKNVTILLTRETTSDDNGRFIDQPVKIEEGQAFALLPPDSDGWLDAVVPGDEVTLVSAKNVLATVNGCQPEDIEIEMKGVAISI